ncbi:glycoside hydrolase family 65 protein [Flavisolibacter tropicus]|uniref:Glycosyl hydrolase family 65 n=1 Tax=Flavisolibacter tropicus TaxID=1492898 RepID=A0A172TQU2_9BACT|nr:glycoside hydrolase family 65 protein [Flavisolibacter tropicus]ANE49177.1 glycosyl hydrolase family 65 [Flavisolibacter tropicus]
MKKLALYIIITILSISAFSQQSDTWKITVNKVNPQDYYGVTVANGMIGIISSPNVLRCKEVVLNGAYDLYGRGRVSNFLQGFNLVNMNLDIDGRRIGNADVTQMRQVLDMRHASIMTSFDYADKATITYTYYSLRHLPYNVLVDVSITAKKNIEVMPASVMEAPDALRDVQNYYNQIDRPHVTLSLLSSTAKSPTGKLTFASSTTFLFDEPHGSEPELIHEMWDNNMHLTKFRKQLKAGTTYHFAIAGASITSAHHEDPLNEAERYVIYAKLEGTKRLLQMHANAWDSLWKSDIVIEGDDASQREVRSAMYHLYSFVREGTAYSPSPMGLSGLGYNGHVFWDTELWMFPAMLLLHPEMAKSMVEYRYQRLQQARHNAFAHGFKGAMYPWESAASGNEETPVWALSGPFEHHITADVAIAAWNYFAVTQDTSWLKEKGFPIIMECADFWASRVERNGSGKYDIKNVVAADEWAENVDNNAFTNAAAKANLQYAIWAARILNVVPSPDWEDVYKNIPILKLENGVTAEHATYKGEKIKQADVNLLAYPLKEITDQQQVRKDLEYYESRIGEGSPAMTHAIFALLYARLKEPTKAWQAFLLAHQPNKKNPFGVLAETAGGNNPYFATGAGGFLQSILSGFGGLDITPTGIVQVPSVLPPGWKKLTLTGIGVNKKTYIVSK